MKVASFSLIELLVVVAIIAALSAMAVPQYKAYQVKTNLTNMVNLVLQKCGNELQILASRQGSYNVSLACRLPSEYDFISNSGPPTIIWNITTAFNSPYIGALTFLASMGGTQPAWSRAINNGSNWTFALYLYLSNGTYQSNGLNGSYGPTYWRGGMNVATNCAYLPDIFDKTGCI